MHMVLLTLYLPIHMKKGYTVLQGIVVLNFVIIILNHLYFIPIKTGVKQAT